MKLTDSGIKYFIGGTVLLTFVIIVFAAIFKPVLAENTLLIHILGVLEGALLTMVTFYWGSSKSSQDKDRFKNEKNENNSELDH
jgi:hypothetical protein